MPAEVLGGSVLMSATDYEINEKHQMKFWMEGGMGTWTESVLVAQSCPTLCDSMDCSLSSSSVHGIHQSRILEWVVISSSRGFCQPGDWTRSPALQADSLPSEPTGKPHGRKTWNKAIVVKISMLHGCSLKNCQLFHISETINIIIKC